jgi:hypothetical protein
MTKKRTSLDSILTRAVDVGRPEELADPAPTTTPVTTANRPGVKQQTVYLKLTIYEQLRRLAFEERGKMHDYLIEGLDLVFRKRGLPGIEELEGRGT